jgi:hypothetical protein
MARDPAALQLRLLQTVVEVAGERNSTLVMPVPVELLRFFDKMAPGPEREPLPPLDVGDAEVAEAEAEIGGTSALPEIDDSAIPPVPEVEAPAIPQLADGIPGGAARAQVAADSEPAGDGVNRKGSSR